MMHVWCMIIYSCEFGHWSEKANKHVNCETNKKAIISPIKERYTINILWKIKNYGTKDIAITYSATLLRIW